MANHWTKPELRLALALYCQMPFGKMHSRNPEVRALATKTPSTKSNHLQHKVIL